MSEKHFDNQLQSEPNVNDTEAYVPILSVNKYKFMDDAFYGGGGFKDGSYLIPHTREMFYKARKELTGYRNFIKPIARALVEPVFVEGTPRVITDVNGNELSEDSINPFGTFVEDCDNAGTPIGEFTEQAVLQTRLHGVSFIVMDNFPAEMQPASMQEAIDNRIMPYVYLRSAEEVIVWENDAYGKLITITFKEQPAKIVEGNTIRFEDRYRMWTEEYSVVMTKDKNNKYVQLSAPVFHNLGCLPVIVTYVQKPRYKNCILVDPPLWDMARLNCVIYNKDSEIRDQERAQAFSCLYIQGEPNSNVTVGPHNVIFLPMDANITPGFASPDPAILAGLVSNADSLRESLFQMAEQNGVVGVKPAESGVAARWHFWATESQLKKSATMATCIEMSIYEMFKEYAQMDFGYVVQYPDDYQPGDATQVIQNYKTIFDLKPPTALANKLWEKTTRLLLEDEDPEEVKEILAEIEAEQEGSTNELPPGDQGTTGVTGVNPPDAGMTGMVGDNMQYMGD